MEPASRHIRKLKIHAQSNTMAIEAQSLIAEAFNVSTFPDAFNHRLVLVKYLNLGRINSATNSQALSMIISNNVQNQISNAVCVDVENAPDAEVVWFSDHVIPYFLLIESQLLRKASSTWYWRVLKKRFFLPDSQHIPVFNIIEKLGEAHVDNLVYVGLLNFLMEKKCLSVFLDQLDQHSVNYMLRHSGIDVSLLNSESIAKPIERSAETAVQTKTQSGFFQRSVTSNLLISDASGSLQSLVSKKVNGWGVKDRRSFFLVYHILLLTNPALIHSTRKIDHVFQVMETLSDNKASAGVINPELDVNPIVKIPDYQSSNRSVHGIISNQRLKFKNKTISTEQHTEQNNQAKTLKGSTPEMNVYRHTSASDTDATTNSSMLNFVAEDLTQKANQQNRTESSPYTLEVSESVANKESSVFEGETHSVYAGLGYLIRLLEIMKFDELLDLNPALAECNFPAIFIRAVASRCGIPDDDSLLDFLGETTELDNRKLLHYCIPNKWLDLVDFSQPLELKKDELDSNQQQLLDHKGCIIAQWLGDMPKHIVILLKNNPYKETLQPNHFLSLDDVVRNALQFMVRYLRNIAAISLRQLVCREGDYVMTKTHVDFIFVGRSVDIRIRRSGLDVNPGWVSWLGCVVSFQYRFSDGETNVR